MIKIIMDSGKEYDFDKSVKDIIDACYTIRTIPNPMGSVSGKVFDAKFLKISSSVIIRTDHISSIEE